MKTQIVELIEKYITPQWKHSGNSNIAIKCPFHKNGQERRPSFFINTDNGLYFCHTCHIGGTVPRLLTDLGIAKHIIDIETSDLKKELAEQKIVKEYFNQFSYVTDPYKANPILSETTLLKFDPISRETNPLPNFNENWLRYMEICIDKTNNRIIYPIRDIYGNLAGVSGGKMLPHQEPKYIVYAGGYKGTQGNWIPSHYGEWFDTQYPKYYMYKKNYIWNYDRVYARLFHQNQSSEIFVVEGFKACLWMLQNGYSNTVALMGSKLSDKQLNLLMRLSSDLILFLDNDPAGKDCTKYMAEKFKKTCKVYRVNYPTDKIAHQPDDFNKVELDTIIANKQQITIKEIVQWKKEPCLQIGLRSINNY